MEIQKKVKEEEENVDDDDVRKKELVQKEESLKVGILGFASSGEKKKSRF